MQRKDIDKIVQDALKNHKPEFKAEFWDEMEQALDAAEQPRSNRRPLMVLFTTLLVAITALSVLFMKDTAMMQNQGQAMHKTAANHPASKALQAKKPGTENPHIIENSAAYAENAAGKKEVNNQGLNTDDNNINNNSIADENTVSATGRSADVSAKENSIKPHPVNKNNPATISNNTGTKKQAFAKKARNQFAVQNTHQNPALSQNLTISEIQPEKVLNKENASGKESKIENKGHNEQQLVITDKQTPENTDVETTIAQHEVTAADGNEADEEVVLQADNKKNSLDLVQKEERSKRKRGSTANWQSITYNFRDNPAYTGNEARYNLSFDTKHFAYEGYGASESRYNIAFDTRIEKLRSSIGVYHQRNLRPLSFAANTGISYAYHIKAGRGGELRLGAGVVQQNRDLYLNSFKYNDQIMPGYGFIFTTGETSVASKTTNYALESGLWYQRSKWMAGFSAKNLYRINTNHEVAQPAHFILAGGANLALGSNFSLLPWAEIHKSDPMYWANTKLLLSWQDKLMGGIAYQNINPYVGFGDISFYAGAQIKQRLRVHLAFGRSSEWLSAGVKQDIIQAGIRYQIK